MKCILCEQELSMAIPKAKALCNNCIVLIVNKAKKSGADFECFADAVAIDNCPKRLVFPEFKDKI